MAGAAGAMMAGEAATGAAEGAQASAAQGLGGVGVGLGMIGASVANEVSESLTAIDSKTIIELDLAQMINDILEWFDRDPIFKSQLKVRLSLLSISGLFFLWLIWREMRAMDKSAGADFSSSDFLSRFGGFMAMIPMGVPAGGFSLPSIPTPTILGGTPLGAEGGPLSNVRVDVEKQADIFQAPKTTERRPADAYDKYGVTWSQWLQGMRYEGSKWQAKYDALKKKKDK